MGDTQNAIDSSSLDGAEDSPGHGVSGQWESREEQDQGSPGHDHTEPSLSHASKPQLPMPKRRRVTRACDECRRKKIKCDGKQPCTHCTVYSYECTYDQPSNRRRNPAPQYVEALEARLERAEALLRTVLPDVNLDDPSDEVDMTHQMQPVMKQEPGESTGVDTLAPLARPSIGPERGSESLLESMVENTGSLDLDEEGHFDFHGNSSGIVFLRCLRDQFGDLTGKAEGYGMPFLKSRKVSSPLNSPKSEGSFGPLAESISSNKEELPQKESARLLCQCALDDACALLRFVHQPTFWSKFDRAYDIPSDQYSHEETHFLPLLYSVLAVGALFAKAEWSHLQKLGYEDAIEQGFSWFNTSRSMMDVTDCRDITSLQTVLFMIMFLQSSSRLSTCYSHIGIVLRSALRMGLHRSVDFRFNPIESQIRQRIFWAIRKMDIYVGALLGLPMFLSGDDIDQELPLEVDDEYITSEKVLPMPEGKLSRMAAFNAHNRLVDILLKTVKYIYPIKGTATGSGPGQSYVVSHDKVREIEQDLQKWMENLPMELRPGGEAPPELSRVQQLLRMAYAHMQMFLYRPFLHYISQQVQGNAINKRSYACAAACVSVSRNIVHISAEMKRRGLLNGSYWFYMYTTFFAILTLVFFVLENPSSPTVKDILRDAHEGRDTLAGLAKRSIAADKCSQTLANLFQQLPGKLKDAKTAQSSQKKRQLPDSEMSRSDSQVSSMRNRPHVLLKPISEVGTPPQQRGKSSPRAKADGFNLSRNQRKMKAPQQQDGAAAAPDYSSLSGYPFKPINGEQTSVEGAAQTPTSGLWPTPGSSQPIPASLPDLGTMMFPTTDPLTYPTQPLSTLEDQNWSRQDDQLNLSLFNANNTPATSNGSYETMDAQLCGPMPAYMMQGQQSAMNLESTDSPMSMGGSSYMPANGGDGDWSMRHMPLSEAGATPGLNYGPVFGGDWSQWMNQGYPQ